MFPHHENEIAQSRAATGKKLANFFVHAEHLLVDGRKMSKSFGNFLTLENIEAKKFEPMALRLLFLQAHYRSQLNFAWESLSAAQAFLQRLRSWADLVLQPKLGHKRTASINYQSALKVIKHSLSEDLNTPKALSMLSLLTIDAEAYGVDVKKLKPLLAEIDDLIGLDLSKRKDITPEQKQLILQREEARTSKDWSKADQMRHQLKKQGIELNDTDLGPIWYRA